MRGGSSAAGHVDTSVDAARLGRAPRAPADPFLTGTLADLLNFVRGEVHVGGSGDAADLVGAADADDGAGHGGIRQSPGDGDFARRCATALADGSERLDQAQVMSEHWLLEVRAVLAPIALRESSDPLPGHGATQHSGGHGGIDDDADAVPQREGENRGFNIPRQKRVGRLEGGDGSDLLGSLHLLGVEIGNADVADLSLCFEFGHFAHGFLNRAWRRAFRAAFPCGPVNLIEIDSIDVQSPQAGFGFAANGGCLEVVRDLSFFIPYQTALGENIGARAEALQRTAYYGFRMSEAVGGRGVDPVDAAVQTGADRGDGLLVVLRTPGEFPLASADGPGSNSNRGNFQVALSERS